MRAACTQPGGGSNLRHARQVQALLRRYRAGGGLGHALNFAGGVLIGGIVVLFAWLMIG
jgi:hypothetical protein